MSLSPWIKERGRALGFDRVGIAPAGDLPELAHFPEWLERGYAGQLDYMDNPQRADVRALWPETRSVICCALAYDTDHPRSTELPRNPERGWLSRYAWGDDYHDIVRQKLEALRTALAAKVGSGFESRAYVDTGPVLERVYAHHAGLGWLAKNTCLLDAEMGSFFFLGVLLTNLELEIDTPPPDGCGSCTLCLEACPSGALVEPYLLDARRCLSYLTIELRDAVPEELRAPMGRHVFGCDICQDVCPYNQRAPKTTFAAFEPRKVAQAAAPAAERDSLFQPRLAWLASLSEGGFQHVFWRSAVKRTKWRGLLRNTLVAMGNSGNQNFVPVLEKFAASDDPLLSEHARWALQQLAEPKS
jgi:epoxyqueuosine reductase